MLKAVIRVRMGGHDAHYGGGIVDGARMLALFGDVATELCIRADGDEGLFRAYDLVEFLAPVRAGDFIEAEGRIIGWGRTSLKMEFVARKLIAPTPRRQDSHESSADVLAEAEVVCRARGTCVVPASVRREGLLRPPGAVRHHRRHRRRGDHARAETRICRSAPRSSASKRRAARRRALR